MIKENNEQYYKRVGARLRSFREEMNFSLADASMNCGKGLSAQYLSMVENGTKIPSMDLLISLARLYRKSLSALVSDGFNTINYNKQKITDSWKEQLTHLHESVPLEIPVYKQVNYKNPDVINATEEGVTGQEPYDYVLWGKRKAEDRLNNGKGLFIIQLQTTNLSPQYNVNDRIIFEPVPFEELIHYSQSVVAIYNGTPRADFNGSKGVSLVWISVEEKQRPVPDPLNPNPIKKVVYKNHGTDTWKELTKKHYLGLGIQVIKSMIVGPLSSYSLIEEHNRSFV